MMRVSVMHNQRERQTLGKTDICDEIFLLNPLDAAAFFRIVLWKVMIIQAGFSDSYCFGRRRNQRFHFLKSFRAIRLRIFGMDSKHTVKMRISAGKRKSFQRRFIIRSGIDHCADAGLRGGRKACAGIAAEGFIIIMSMYVDQHISNTASCVVRHLEAELRGGSFQVVIG